MKFTELNLPYHILKALENMGYKELTPIQEEAYPIILSGQDLCALAETGSGKTSACAIPLIQRVDIKQNSIQGIVIVPTRELCIQYVDEIQKIAKKTGVVPFAAYGGFDKSIQKAKIKHGVHILVATPGRLMDLMYDGTVDLSNVRCAILDEADQLLQVGFFEDIEFIMSCIIHEHQTLLFSATMSDKIKELAHDCLRNPKHISLVAKRAIPKSIKHYFLYINNSMKYKELVKYFEREKIVQAIIFCNARHLVNKLYGRIKKDFKDAEYIHAGLDQGKRSSIFRQFKKKKIRYLIATDVAGRGLDFSHVSHVVNWDFPRGEQYTHRTGRTGRMGRKGKSFTFVIKDDIPALRDLIKTINVVPIWIGKNPLQKKNQPLSDKTV